MQVFRGFQHPGIAPACALTIGNFDGVHRGHQAMLALLRSEAQHRGLPSCLDWTVNDSLRFRATTSRAC